MGKWQAQMQAVRHDVASIYKANFETDDCHMTDLLWACVAKVQKFKGVGMREIQIYITVAMTFKS